MSYAVRKDGKGWRAVQKASDCNADEVWQAHQPGPLAPTPEDIQEQITNQVQQRLDAFAREREYDGIVSLCSYAGDPDLTLSAEGNLGVAKRSQTWVKMKQIRAEVLAGTRPMPTSIADIEAELPALTWPA